MVERGEQCGWYIRRVLEEAVMKGQVCAARTGGGAEKRCWKQKWGKRCCWQ